MRPRDLTEGIAPPPNNVWRDYVDQFRMGGRCEKHLRPKPCELCALEMASRETTKENTIEDMVKEFVIKHRIRCAENVFDRDGPVIDAASLVADLIDAIGFYYQDKD